MTWDFFWAHLPLAVCIALLCMGVIAPLAWLWYDGIKMGERKP